MRGGHRQERGSSLVVLGTIDATDGGSKFHLRSKNFNFKISHSFFKML